MSEQAPEWPGQLSREDAIGLLDKITDHEHRYDAQCFSPL